MKKIILAVSSAALLTMGGGGFAAVNTDPVPQQISVTVTAGCTVAAMTPFDFGSISSGVAPTAKGVSAGNVVATCQGALVPIRIGIDAGLHAAGTQRKMSDVSGTSFVDYTLSLTSQGTDIGTDTMTVTPANPFGKNAATPTAGGTTAIFANILASSIPTKAGAHTDTVNYYVEF